MKLAMGGEDRAGDQLLCEIERDFKVLVGLIERAIAHVSAQDCARAELKHLVRARKAAELGASLARKDIERRGAMDRGH